MVERFEGSTAYRASKGRFGGPVRLVEYRRTVSTSPSVLLSENPRRLAWTICNRTSQGGAIGFDRSLTYGNGLFLSADGGSVSMEVDVDGEAVGYAVYGVVETGSGTWYVWEVYSV